MTSEPAVERVKWVVRGRVQGVGFRWHVARVAQGLPLVGWVTNLPDGSVEVVVEGSAEAVRSLEQVVRSGPRAAVVERVDKSHPSPDMVIPKVFEIR